MDEPRDEPRVGPPDPPLDPETVPGAPTAPRIVVDDLREIVNNNHLHDRAKIDALQEYFMIYDTPRPGPMEKRR